MKALKNYFLLALLGVAVLQASPSGQMLHRMDVYNHCAKGVHRAGSVC
jgi:hypothetical protein